MSQRAGGLLWAKMKLISLFLPLFLEQIQAGSTEMIQKFLPTGKESNISFPEEKLPKSSTVSWFDPSNRTIGTYYSYGETKVEKCFDGKVNITGPRALTFLSPQISDCGVYSAKVIGVQSKTVNFFVTFQDPVSPVELKLNVIPDSPCEFKATCSTEDDEIIGTLMCDDKSCRLAGGERSNVTTSGASLGLYQSNESIICNHSNQINWTQSKKGIQPCSGGSKGQTTLIVVAVLLIVAGLFVFAIIGVLCCLNRKLLCFAQRQTESSDSQMLPPPPQANGDPQFGRLMDENIADSPV